MLEQLKNKLKIKKMTENIILKETITKGRPEIEKKPKKKYYKTKTKNVENVLTNMVANSEKPFVAASQGLKIPKSVGSYCMGNGKRFHIHLEKKPNWLNRKCMKLFLGWEWVDSKSK
jgi:hypothetical protein